MTIKKILAIILVLIMAFSLSACGNGGNGNTPDNNPPETPTPAPTLPVDDPEEQDEDPCDCCPDCDRDNCEFNCDKCECCVGSGNDEDNSITFMVEHKTHLHLEDGAVYNDVQLSGVAIVTLDQYDEETGTWGGSAVGVGQYDNWEFLWDGGDELILDSEGFDYTVNIYWYDPLAAKGIIVAFDRFESNTVMQIAPNSPDLSGPIPSHTNMFLDIFASDYRDTDNGLFYFEVPLVEGTGQKTLSWQGDGVNAHAAATLELTITVTRLS